MITHLITSLPGQDINLAMKGLLLLERFLGLAASAVTDREIIEALNYKLKQSDRTGLYQKWTQRTHVFVILASHKDKFLISRKYSYQGVFKY